jgi:quercetin dioxygenase-like cupin family protein
MPVITIQDAPVFDTGGALITGLAAPSRGSRDVAAWRVALLADHPSPAHSLTREEVFVVLSGAVTAQFVEHAETAAAGGALVVPAGVEFSLIAHGGPAEAICILPVGGQADTGSGAFTPPWAE